MVFPFNCTTIRAWSIACEELRKATAMESHGPKERGEQVDMRFGIGDPQDIVNTFNQVIKDERARYHVTLGRLIEVLEQVPEEIPVRFVGGGAPDRIDSYRGYYSDLAISVQYEREVIAKVFLLALRTALNTRFEGYKGGQYLMEADTPLWCSAWGETSNKAIIDVSVTDGRVALWLKEIN